MHKRPSATHPSRGQASSPILKSTTAVLIALFLTPFTPTAAWAQQETAAPGADRSFAQLSRSRTLKQGDTVWILADLSGTGAVEELRASFEALRGRTISVSVDALPGGANVAADPTNDGYLIVLPEDRVLQIDGEYADSLANGVGYGAFTGFVALGLPALIASSGCPGEGIVAYLCIDTGMALGIGAVGAGIGAGIGAILDATHKGRGVVYTAPGLSGRGAAISLSPIITRKSKGFLLEINW